VEDLPDIAASNEGLIGVISTPAPAAQQVADLMVRVGIRSILNFAPIALAVPEGVSVRKVDLAVELQILTYYEQRKAALLDVKRRGRAALG
jgi:redox-sensing transcriptional repressor